MQQIKITVYDGIETNIKYQGIHNVSDTGGEILDIQLPDYLYIGNNLILKVENLSTSIDYELRLDSYIELSGGLFAPIINGKQVYTGQELSLLEKSKLDGVEDTFYTRFFTYNGNYNNGNGIKFSNLLDKTNSEYKEYAAFFKRNASIGCNNNLSLLGNSNNIKVIGNNNTLGASGNETTVNILGNYNTFNTSNYSFGTTILGNNNTINHNGCIIIANNHTSNYNNEVILGNAISRINNTITLGDNNSGSTISSIPNSITELNYTNDFDYLDNFRLGIANHSTSGTFNINTESISLGGGIGQFDFDGTIIRNMEVKRVKVEGIFNSINGNVDFNLTTIAELGTPGSDLNIAIQIVSGMLDIQCTCIAGDKVVAGGIFKISSLLP